MIDQKVVREIYTSYGFLEKRTAESGVLIFTIFTGHFHNADIVIINENDDGAERIFNELKNSGYAPKKRKYSDENDLRVQLFRGFFSVDQTKKRLAKEYIKYTNSIVSVYSDNAKYKYINVKYSINNVDGQSDVIDEIFKRICSDKPVLFLIEAAAGFGKTSTAYELVNKIVIGLDEKIPLFCELSRNRQAKIFRYVLLDEIERWFPFLNSKLVHAEIRNGNVPVVLDGFDELLRSSSDKPTDGYEQTEPMLETIGEILQGKSKVILTTRRTAIFDGDEFHEWMESHIGSFDVVRIKLNEPLISDWLPQNRISKLNEASIPIDRMSNPVILSYLRCIDDVEFEAAISSQDEIINKYFTSMFERERSRQDLMMSAAEQNGVLTALAGDMLEHDYTAESKDYIVKILNEKFSDLVDSVWQKYPAEHRPSKDQIITKLASHAFLDRSENDDKRIGFVNDFVLGNFSAEHLFLDGDMEAVVPDVFVEPIVRSYRPRTTLVRNKLLKYLRFSFEFLRVVDRLRFEILLTDRIETSLVGETITKVKINDISLDNIDIKDCVFFECIFSNVNFVSDRVSSVTFVECSFYGCHTHGDFRNNNIKCSGCNFDDSSFEGLFCAIDEASDVVIDNLSSECEKFVLERFWPVGKPSFYKIRPIKTIITHNNKFSQQEIFDAIDALKEKRMVVTPDNASVSDFLQLNVEVISQIRKILGR